ncbi:MAG: PDZ domain-containing protein [bacterium]|nr:PDZ domain-containing protein [bacterium]
MKKLKQTIGAHRVLASLLVALLMISTASFLTAGKEGKEKKSTKAFLGVSLERLAGEDKEEFGVKFGVLVISVSKDEAAAKAGVKKYDVIQYFNGERIRRPADLTEAVRDSKPGDKATIKLVRDGQSKTVTAALGEREMKRYSFRFGDGDHTFKHIAPKVYAFGDKKLKWKSKGKDGNFFISAFGGAYLGVRLGELTDDLAGYFGVNKDDGALVLSVEKDTPAEKAGLKGGDVITKINDKKITGNKDLKKILSKMEEGDKVSIQVTRHKKNKTFNAELAKHKSLSRIEIFGGDGKDFHFGDHEVHVAPGDHGDEHNIIIERKHRKKKEKKKEKKILHHLKKVKENSQQRTLSI